MLNEQIREMNKIANELGYDITVAEWCEDCVDIWKMDSEMNVPEFADYTIEEAKEFINSLA